MDYMDPRCPLAPKRPINLISLSLRCDMAFIEPMHRNKPNISSLSLSLSLSLWLSLSLSLSLLYAILDFHILPVLSNRLSWVIHGKDIHLFGISAIHNDNCWANAMTDGADCHHTYWTALRWRHNQRDGVSNHQPPHCLLNRLLYLRLRSKKTSKLRVTGLCEGNSPMTVEFPAQMASDAENVSIWWRHHGIYFEEQHYVIPWDSVNFVGALFINMVQP